LSVLGEATRERHGHRGDGDGQTLADPAGWQVIDEHCAVFWRLLDRAAGLRRRRADAAAVYAEIAANYAMSHHPGLFASPELERLLLAIGRSLPSPPQGRAGSARADGAPRAVLHVLTRAFDIGGDARTVWRWIGLDDGRAHSVVLTRQGAVPVPAPLREAVAASGGQVHVLNERRGGLLAWASVLRDLAARADLVALHVHPYDVIPTLAFADKACTPPVVFVDHADHAFWVGTGTSDIVAALRASGRYLARERRGVAPERSALLPIPLSPPPDAPSRAEARAQLGLAEDALVLLSIARPHKYTPIDDESFIEAVSPILERHPSAVLLVIGPDHAGPWAEAAARTGGRVRALGLREDTAPFYRAADLYLDSYPVVSITSLLEAGGHGLPLVSRPPPLAAPGVLGADTPGLGHLVRARGAAGLRAAVGHLLADPEYRAWLGEATRRDIAAAHTGDAWRRSLHALYRQALAAPPVAMVPDQADRRQVDDLDLLLPEVFRGEPDLDTIRQFYLRLLPADLRLLAWLSRLRSRRPLPAGLLLPEWLGIRLERWRYPEGSDRYDAPTGIGTAGPALAAQPSGTAS
jgi:glycosyltransferase involved in cell wall biosynthesis